VFMKGTKTSEAVSKALQDLYVLKKDYSVNLSDRWDVHPFDSQEELEHVCNKHDTGLFIFGSNSKKRPNNMVLGRVYDKQVLDMLELGLTSYKPLTPVNLALHHRPCVIFQGDIFEFDPIFQRIKNLLMDFFVENVKPKTMNIREGLNHFVTITAGNDKNIFIRNYELLSPSDMVLNSDADLDKMLVDIGGSFDFEVRRTKFANDEQFKKACKQAKVRKEKHEKNIKTTAIGEHLGRVFVEKQNLDALALKKRKKLKTEGKPKADKDIQMKEISI